MQPTPPRLDRRAFGTLLGAGLLGLVLPATAAPATALPLAPLRPVTPTGPAATPTVRRVTFGRSVEGRPLSALVLGDTHATRRVVVVGVIHGNEAGGRPVLRALARTAPPAGTQLWLVDSVNPDGERRGTRQNARGVDLNRNFPYRWHGGGSPGDTYYPGPGPLSEPESHATAALLHHLQPTVTIWYHQHLDLVDASAGDLAVARRYARRSGTRFSRLEAFGGSATTWQAHDQRRGTGFVVELPAVVPAALSARHAAAVVSALRDLA